MPRTGTATLPLYYGRAPRWLFDRMRLLKNSLGLGNREKIDALKRTANFFGGENGCA